MLFGGCFPYTTLGLYVYVDGRPGIRTGSVARHATKESDWMNTLTQLVDSDRIPFFANFWHHAFKRQKPVSTPTYRNTNSLQSSREWFCSWGPGAAGKLLVVGVGRGRDPCRCSSWATTTKWKSEHALDTGNVQILLYWCKLASIPALHFFFSSFDGFPSPTNGSCFSPGHLCSSVVQECVVCVVSRAGRSTWSREIHSCHHL